MSHNQHFGTERQYSSIQTCQRRELRFDWQRHGTARSRRRESWEKQPSHHSEEAGGKRAAGTAGAGQNHTQEPLNRRQGRRRTGKRAPLSHPLPSEGWVWVANAALLPQQPPAPRRLQRPALFPPTGERAEAERSGQGSLSPPPLPRSPAESLQAREVLPKLCSHGRRVGTRSSRAGSTEAAFPRSPTPALPTPLPGATAPEGR